VSEIVAKIEVKIVDLDYFKELVAALVQWAEEIKDEAYLSDAESVLFNAAVKLSDKGGMNHATLHKI
jgi:hypothetical protein